MLQIYGNYHFNWWFSSNIDSYQIVKEIESYVIFPSWLSSNILEKITYDGVFCRYFPNKCDVYFYNSFYQIIFDE